MNRTKRYAIGFTVLFIFLIALLILNIAIGTVKINITDIIRAIISPSFDLENKQLQIIRNIRLPRVMATMLLGGALAEAGFLLQTFFANPIAGPFVLGISSGAKLTVALTMIFSLTHGVMLNSTALIIAAFVGAIISLLFVLVVSKHVKRLSLVIICGVMVGYICSAITDIMVAFADDSNIVNLHNWSMGSFSGISAENVRVIFIIVAIAFLLTLLLSKEIGAYQLGEVYAANLGVNIKRFRIKLIVLSSLLSACVTAFAGPISFVGIAVPQLVKMIFKTTKPLVVIPASFLGGASFCLLCDLLARKMFSPMELSISSVTAVFGAPVVLWVLIKNKQRTA